MAFSKFRAHCSELEVIKYIFGCFQIIKISGKILRPLYRGADKFLARPARKQDTATENFDIHISYL
jgi:hypothetical protein